MLEFDASVGLQIKIGKLRDKDHFIPLRDSELSEIDS
jgi:hypothetical protein